MATQPNITPMSVEDYLKLDRESMDARYEFVDGYAYMLAGGTADHSTLGVNAASLLVALLRGSQCRVYNSDVKVFISKQRYLIPDVSVTCDPRDRGKIDIIHHPQLVIEVLSSSTEAYDRGRKFEFYRSCPTLQDYVLVGSQWKAVDVYRRASENLWTLYPYGPGDQIHLHSLDISISIEDLYENVFLTEEHM